MKTRPQIIFILLLTLCMQGFGQKKAPRLRMLTYNIRHGEGLDSRIDLDRQAAVIQRARADVVGLQEVDSCARRSGYTDQAAALAERLGMFCTFSPAIPLTGGKYGVAILSREKPLSVRRLPLPGTEKRTLLVCEFGSYVFATTHLDLDENMRAASLPIIREEAARWEKPFFICGDWNDEPSSKLLEGMQEAGFVILGDTSQAKAHCTFPADKPAIIIDYIASYGKACRSVKHRKVLRWRPAASDHRPVLVEVGRLGN